MFKRKPNITRLPLTKARINFGQVIKKTHIDKEYFILEKDGIPVAGIMDINEFEDYLETKFQNKDLESQINEGYQSYQQGNIRSADDFLKALKKEQ